jgi:hypothetical protein
VLTGGVVGDVLSLLFLQENKMAGTQANMNNVNLIDEGFRVTIRVERCTNLIKKPHLSMRS